MRVISKEMSLDSTGTKALYLPATEGYYRQIGCDFTDLTVYNDFEIGKWKSSKFSCLFPGLRQYWF